MADAIFPWKLRRTREHTKAFDEAVQWWLESEPYRIAEEVDVETDTKQFVVIAERQPPVRLSLLLGDMIQNLRSTLDYLVGDLARHNAGGHLMPRIEADLMFPITTSREKFKDAVRRQARLGCVAARPAALIQRLQPYRHGQDPATHPLWVLHQLSNIDKHRHLALLMSVVTGMAAQDIRIESVNSFTFGMLGPFKDRAVLAEYSPANANVHMDLGQVAVDVALGDGLPWAGRDVRGAFRELFGFVAAGVLNPLAAYLEHSGPPSTTKG